MAVSKEYIQWFDTEDEAWKFAVAWRKLTKYSEEPAKLAVQFYTGKWWVLLKKEVGE